ncbi:hypothetical protein ACTDI4_11695 [Mesorhizobium sp. PUT5]
MSLSDIQAKRRENRRIMKTAEGELLDLCRQLEDVLAVMAYRARRA